MPESAGRSKVMLSRARLRPFEKLLQSVAVLMLRQGTPSEQISKAMERALLSAQTSDMGTPALKHLYVALSKVLHAWHQDREYVDARARPLALTLQGEGKSIYSLVAAVGVRVRPEEVISSLKSQKLIRRLASGKYVPIRNLAQIGGDGPEMTGYLGQSVLSLIETLEANRRGQARAKPLLERTAIVQDLNKRDAIAFQRFSAEQGASFIANANAWLESRRTRGNRGSSGVTAGVHVFAFVTRAARKR